MPYRNYRKKAPKGKKKMRKRVYRRIPRPFARADYSTIVKTDQAGALTPFANDSLVVTRGALTFALNQVPEYARFTALFDQYRINRVVVKFIPTMSTLVNRPYDDTTTILVGEGVPRLATAIDRDDDQLPSSTTGFNDLQGRQGSKVVQATRPVTWSFVPTRLSMVYRTASTTGYKVDSQTREFLDCANDNIPHYGLKYALTPFSPANAFQYRVETTYYLSFKSRRM